MAESELRKRTGELNVPGKGQETTTAESSDHIDSEEEKFLEERYAEEMSKTLPQGTDKTPEMLRSAVSGLPDRWRNWVIRGVFTFLMISGFALIIYGGPLALMITTLLVQVQCFQEIISIGYQQRDIGIIRVFVVKR